MKKPILCILFILLSYPLYSQNLLIYNVDTSNYPTVTANFFAFDAAWNQQSPDKSELVLTENGSTRTLYNLTCATPKKPLPVSSVLMLDVSHTMDDTHLNVAKDCAGAWVNVLKNDKSECALTSFDHFNYFNQDFTTDKTKLVKAINGLSSGGGTDYNKALIDPFAGGLIATKTGKYQKVLILLIDGLSSSVPEFTKIIDEAKLQKCKIFVLSIDMTCPQILKDICSQTGGTWFENINDQTKKDELFRIVLHLAQGNEPCILPWKSVATCDTSDIDLELSWKGVKASTVFPMPAIGVHRLQTNPNTVQFGITPLGTQRDTIIKLSAKGVDYKITAINLIYGDAFRIENINLPLTIPKNTNYNITVRYTPTETNLCYGGFEVVTDYCNSTFSCFGGDRAKSMTKPTLKLTHPNGAEKFLMNVDTLITWEGVVPTDTVNLEYSLDNGIKWTKITDRAVGLKYIWKEIPSVESYRCLIRVSQGCIDSTPRLIFQKALGGSKSETVSSFQQTKDGGYILAGSSSSNDNDVTGNKGMNDYWVVKLSPLGLIEWQSNYGGTRDDIATSIIQTSDNGYVVVGTTNSSDGDVTDYQGAYDIWVIRLNSKGQIIWQKTLGGSAQDNGNYVQQTNDGGYIVGGYSLSRDGEVNKDSNGTVAWIGKLDAAGNFSWGKIIGSENDKAICVKQTVDNGYIIAVQHSVIVGGMPPKITSQYSFIKVNASGTTQWDKIYGGAAEDVMTSIAITPDGGYIAAGYSNSMDGDVTGVKGNYDYWVLKVDAGGNKLWQKTMGGTSDDFANSIVNTEDGGYIVAGESLSKNGDITYPRGLSDAWLVKLSSTGIIQWQNSFGGSGNDIAESIIQTRDRGYAFVATTSSSNGDVTGQKGVSDYWFVKLGTEKYNLQSDESDASFTIIPLDVECSEINMQKCLIGETKDSSISEIIKNTGNQTLRIDSVYFRGADAAAFSIVSVLPKYTLAIGGTHNSELRFKPTHVGANIAEMAIITQSDTVFRKIQGEGIQSTLEIVNKTCNFGKVRVGSEVDSLQLVVVRNVGTTDMTVPTSKHSGPNITDFTSSQGVDNLVLKPGEVIKYDFKFKPSDVGRTSGLYEIYYDGVGSPIQIQLYGEGLLGSSQDLISPENDTINAPVDLVLKWQGNPANSSYILQVAKDEDFTSIVIDKTLTETSYKCPKLDFLQTYHWRVKSISGSEQSSWSPLWRFTTLMDTIALLTPVNLSKNNALPINLNWNKGIYEKDYRLQISKSNDFATKIKDTLISKFNNADIKNLNNSQNYFWRVRNESGDTLGYWSKIWQFKTGMSNLTLIYPENAQQNLEQEINFKWSNVVGAEYYQLQISKNEQFTDLVYSKDSILTTERNVPDLEPEKLYYWRVRVWNQESIGTAYWSEVWTFRTGASGVADESEFIQITPNPAGEYITISLKPSEGFEPSEGSAINIYNTLGEKVWFVGTCRDLFARIDISDLPKGIYFVKVGGETKKFVKM